MAMWVADATMLVAKSAIVSKLPYPILRQPLQAIHIAIVPRKPSHRVVGYLGRVSPHRILRLRHSLGDDALQPSYSATFESILGTRR